LRLGLGVGAGGAAAVPDPPAGVAAAAGAPEAGAPADAPSRTRVALMRPLQPRLGQSPRQVARPLGAVVSTTRPQTLQVPRTFSPSAMVEQYPSPERECNRPQVGG